MSAHYAAASSLFDGWADDVLHGKKPEEWYLGRGFEKVDIGPGLVVVLGGAPGAGKTALGMQWAIDALRQEESLRAMVLNVEMPPRVLLDRQLSRLSGVDATWIRNRTLAGHESRIEAGLDELRRIAPRLAFHTGKPTLADVARSTEQFGARLLILDYLQRIGLGTGEAALDKRTELENVMGYVRRFADAGLGVLAICAVARQKGKGGSNYAGLGLASFRGSSELEYGADSAFVLEANEEGIPSLSCEKNRHGERFSLTLKFDGARQSFEVAHSGSYVANAAAFEEDDHGAF